MMVGTTGVDRVVTRTAELMREHDTDDIAPHGGIPLAVIQRYLNFHYSVSLDLFGSETSTNVANYFTNGVKGRWQEERRADDHVLTEGLVEIETVADGRFASVATPALVALNQDLRGRYSADCATGVTRWNRVLREHGVDARLALPHAGFNRAVGMFAGHHVSPDGRLLAADEWAAHRDHWLPSADDLAHVASLMRPVFEPGHVAAWIAPPRQGIDGHPSDFAYVHLT